jgi:hypothetical protein
MNADATERSERFMQDDESCASATPKLPVDDIVPSEYSSLISVLLQGVEPGWR